MLSLLRAFGIVALLAFALAACTSPSAPKEPTTGQPSTTAEGSATPSNDSEDVAGLPDGWIEEEITFPTELGTFHGAWTHHESDEVTPAALIIGGSGPVDRDGNQPPTLATMNTLLTLSQWLAEDGVASLRYDKPGSGDTGLGDITEDMQVTFTQYLTSNGQALAFLAAQDGVDPSRISVVGHSEGGLFAIMLAAGQHGSAAEVPAVHSVAGLEPLSLPMLTILQRQLSTSITKAQEAGQLTEEQAGEYEEAVTAAIAAVRAGEPIPEDTPPDIAGAFPPSALTYLRTEDAVDPRMIAAELPEDIPVLLSCSDADIQVTCDEVRQLTTAAEEASDAVDLVPLTGVSHILKEDDSKTSEHYNDDLPFSSELREAMSSWAKK